MATNDKKAARRKAKKLKLRGEMEALRQTAVMEKTTTAELARARSTIEALRAENGILREQSENRLSSLMTTQEILHSLSGVEQKLDETEERLRVADALVAKYQADDRDVAALRERLRKAHEENRELVQRLRVATPMNPGKVEIERKSAPRETMDKIQAQRAAVNNQPAVDLLPGERIEFSKVRR